MRDMAQIERAVTRLTGDRQGAARFRRELTAAVQKEAVKAAPRIMAEVIGEELKAGEAGWVNDPVRDKAVLVQAKTGCVLLDDKGKPILRPRIAYPKTPNIDLGNFVKHLKRSDVENIVPYMYLDSKGNVTVGIGILLETAQEAISLHFVIKGSAARAHPTHVEKAYNNVKSAPAGMKWPLYEKFSNIVISEAEATSRALTFINIILVEINVVFPDFDTYPVKAKMGFWTCSIRSALQAYLTGGLYLEERSGAATGKRPLCRKRTAASALSDIRLSATGLPPPPTNPPKGTSSTRRANHCL